MDVDALRLLLAVARRGSIAAAARDRGLDPSTVSRAVAASEAELGVRLFQRTTRRLTPTEAGALYLERVEPLVAELDRARDAARLLRAGPSGTLRLTASVSFGQWRIVPLLPAFRARFPDLKIDCVFTDANLDLVAEQIDLAIRLAPAVTGDVVATRLVPTRYRVVASPAYLSAAPPLTEPAQLTHHRCLLFPISLFRARWLFRDRNGRMEEVPVDGDVVISPGLGLRDAALAGLGPTMLADWLVGEDIAAGRLVDIFPRHDVTATTFDTAAWLIYPSRTYLPNKVRVTIDFLRRSFHSPISSDRPTNTLA